MTWMPLDRPSLIPSHFPDVSGKAVSVVFGNELLTSLKALIEGVGEGEVLRVMSPIIDDSQVISWLRASRKRGAVVRILTTLVDRHGVRTKGWDAAENIESHGESVRELAKCGCLLRSTRTTPHGKFVLGGYSKLWFGSANLASGALGGRVVEAGVVLDDDGVSGRIQTIFDQFWKSAPYRMVHRQGAILIEEKGNPTTAVAADNFPEDGASVWISAPGVSTATFGINRLLESAADDILLVAMSLYELDEVPNMQELLLRALRRGVRVRAVVRQEHFASEELNGRYPDSATYKLLESGMELLGVRGLHAKGFLLDDRWCGIQSANFNPYSLDWRREECNVELIIVGDARDKSLRGFPDWMRGLLVQATHYFVIDGK